jgi:hypothetical protein
MEQMFTVGLHGGKAVAQLKQGDEKSFEYCPQNGVVPR